MRLLLFLVLLGACSSEREWPTSLPFWIGDARAHVHETFGEPEWRSDRPDLTREKRTNILSGRRLRPDEGLELYDERTIDVLYDAQWRVKGLHVDYAYDGQRFEGHIFGIRLGDPVRKWHDLAGEPVRQTPSGGMIVRVAHWEYEGLQIRVRVWDRDMNGWMGRVKAGTIAEMRVRKK